MSFQLRSLEKDDVPAVARLLAKAFPNEPYTLDEWERGIEWMCFPTEFGDDIPRGLVVAGDQGVVAHIGLTVSEFTDGVRSLKLVQTVDWTVDRSQNAGLWAVKLLVQATSSADAAIIVGGNKEAQAIFPKIGFEKRLDVGRYIKIKRPAQFLAAPTRRGEGWRQPGKLGVWLARSVAKSLTRPGSPASETPRLDLRVVAPEKEDLGALWSRLRPDGNAGQAESVMRNSLEPALVRWYGRCPKGDVKVMEFRTEDSTVAIAAVLFGTRGAYPFATILSVDVAGDDAAEWTAVLRAIDEFATQAGVTHLNAMGSYAPWCDALEGTGYARLRSLPLWVRDTAHLLDDVQTWHLSAIEGDLGYLLT